MMTTQLASVSHTHGPKNIPPPSDDIPDAGSAAVDEGNSLYSKDDSPMDAEDDYSDEADADDVSELDGGDGIDAFSIETDLNDTKNEA